MGAGRARESKDARKATPWHRAQEPEISAFREPLHLLIDIFRRHRQVLAARDLIEHERARNRVTRGVPTEVLRAAAVEPIAGL